MTERGRKNSVSHTSIIAISIAIGTLLLLSSPANIFIQVQSVHAQTQSPANWGTNANEPFNWDYSTQTQVSPSNVGGEAVKWVFPVPESPPPYTGQGDEGVVASPIIEGGIAYVITNWNEIYALNAATGTVVWQQAVPILPINAPAYSCGTTGGAKAIACGVNTATHIHNGEWEFTSTIFGKPLIWVDTPSYTVYAYNALTGTPFMNLTWFNPADKVPGNFGVYDPISANMMVIDEKRGILVVGTENGDCECEGRGFVDGWNLMSNPPTLLWQQFLLPPQDGSDPNWSLDSVGNMTTGAYIFNGTGAVNLKTLPASTLHSVLYNDWGTFGYNGTRSYAGLGVNWGGPWALDNSTGMVYVSTAEVAPAQNATYRPGPNLWSDSILAFNDQTGQTVWGFQATPHDLVDWDCSWGTVLANVTIGGTPQKEIIKGCKNGYIYGLDAATGALNWYLLPPSEDRGPTKGVAFVNDEILNPLNPTNMTKLWRNYPSTSPAYTDCPGTGCIESDPAYDPATGMVYFAVYNDPRADSYHDVGPMAASWIGNTGYTAGSSIPPTNTTITAVNAATGQIEWTHYYGNFGYRGGLTVSDGLVYVVTPTGGIDWLSATTGDLVATEFLGAPSIIQPAVGTDPNGNTVIVIPASATTSPVGKPSNAGNVPGVVMGLELSSASTGPATTVTVTSTAPGATVTSTTAGAPATVPTATVTVTSTAPGATVTAASSGGVSSSAFYGVAAVAVIFIIATGFLAMRGKKPAS